MISSKKENLVWIFDFVGQKKADCFQRPFPSEKYNRAIRSFSLNTNICSKNNGHKHRVLFPWSLVHILKFLLKIRACFLNPVPFSRQQYLQCLQTSFIAIYNLQIVHLYLQLNEAQRNERGNK